MVIKRAVNAVLISPSWPVPNSGMGLATTSALWQYARFFDRVHFIGLVDHPFKQQELWVKCPVKFSYVPITRLPKGLRFVFSLASPLPAIVHQFLSRQVRKQIVTTIAEESRHEPGTMVIFEDMPASMALLPLIRRQFPALPVAIRSENVASKVFLPFRDTGSWFHRLAWSMEIAKIHKQEAAACRLADQVWAISKVDLEEYKSRLNVRCDGVFGVSIDTERYSSVPEGDPYTLISVGTVDLRKSLGLRKFIEVSWPEILRRYPMAKLLLGGANSEQFTNPSLNIIGLGRVEDDRDVLSQGLIMLNTQEIGAGINLKSIVAMASGKALVSTQKGIEGIEGENGVHFLTGPDVKSLAPLVLELMANTSLARQMGKAAQELALIAYSDAQLSKQAQLLLGKFVLKTRGRDSLLEEKSL